MAPTACAADHAGPDASAFSRHRPAATMKHTRIRPFNTKTTYPEQKLDNDLCQAVVARGRTVFLRGQIGQNLDTSESVCIGDVAGQVFVFFILTVAAAEAAIGLAILVTLFRNRRTINVAEIDTLKG